MSKNALKFMQNKLPKQPDELGRLKVLQGPDRGATFVLTAHQATLGRGEENDIILADLKSSRRHAELVMNADGSWSAQDLGSANGIVYNNAVVRNAQLRTGDQLAIGETVFEFFQSSAGTRTVMAPLASVTKNFAFPVIQKTKTIQRQSYVASGISSIPGLSGSNVSASFSQKESTQGKSLFKRPLVLVLLAVVAFLYLFDQPTPSGKSSTSSTKIENNQEKQRNLASYLPPDVNEFKLNSAEMFFREGFREYREKNYLRAKTQFETALQIDPHHSLASLYLSHCEQSIEEEVQYHLENGRKGILAGKLKESRGHFEAIMRLMYKDQTSPYFIEAQDQWKIVDQKIREGNRS